jgi:aminopeptidase N
MLEFFSNRLGVDYPWEKYSQVIVRDYVSGAMENTTAVVHGDFFNQTAREMLDGDNESTVAHELFHHWFGDLVTCESWSNLPLNESFATYGEYLWLEKAYGRDEADYHGQTDLRRYLSESAQKKEDLIRFFYSDKEDMFDMHSYAKGGRVLNMLRRYLGDDAFFEGLKVYLNENKFQSVEIHNLRLAMEKVSGEDLNWFFNQWFLNKGHPVLSIETNFDSLNLRQNVVITQMQEKGENPLYKIPLDVDIYYPNGKERQRIWITKRTEIISINVKEKPVWVNVDAEKQLLGVKIEKKTKEEWIWQLKQGPLFLDKYEAIAQIAPYSSEPEVADLLIKATKDSHFAIRSLALKTLTIKSFADQEEHKSLLRNMAQNDPKSSVRATAIRKMEPYASVQTLPFLKDIAQNDLSYQVIGEALSSTNAIDSKEGIEMARKLASEAKGSLLLNIAIILADKGAESDSDFFKNGFAKVSDNNAKYTFTALIGRYLSNQDLELQSKMLPMLEGIARNESAWYIRLAAIQGLNEISLKIQNRISELKKSTAANSSDTAVIDRLNQQQKAIDELLADIKSKENDPKVKRIIGG